MHAGFRRVLRRSGYFQVKSTMEFVVKVNARRRAGRRSTRTPTAGTSRSATRTRIDDAAEPSTSLHLLVGIDTEGDNQWDAAARANQTFENIYALPRLHALFARHGVRPTYVITYPVATDRAVGGGAARAAAPAATARSARTITPGKRRRAPRTTCAGIRTRRRCRARSSRRSSTSLTDGDRRAPSATRPVSYRSGRFGFSADHVAGARTARLPGRVERRAAVLRSAQGRAGVRRGAAHAVLPRLRQRDHAGHAATCSRCRSRRR